MHCRQYCERVNLNLIISNWESSCECEKFPIYEIAYR